MLRPALSSALGQSHPNVEIVFVDDGSDDGSLDVARQLRASSSRAFEIATTSARGVNHARILGLSLARGDFVQWLDADDEIAPGKIAAQIAFLDAHRDVDIAYCDWVECNHLSGGPPMRRRRRTEASTDHARRILALGWYPPNAYLIRRAAADRLAEEEAFFPSRPVATDVEYFAIAAMLGQRFAHVDGTFAAYNVWSQAQMSDATNYLLRVATLREIFSRLNAIAERKDVRRRIKADHRALLNQSWDLWALPAGSLEWRRTGARHTTLASKRTGGALSVTPREAKAISFVESGNIARFLAHHAAEISLRDAEIFRDQAEAIFFLDRLRAAGLLLKVDPATAQLESTRRKS